MSERVIVQKYGGAALASIESIQRAAHRVAEIRNTGQSLCVVVSAMGATTDDLLALAKRCGGPSPEREVDALLACGENMSAALFAMCLRAEGVNAMSLSGLQAGIVTTAEHGHAEVRSVRADRVAALLADGVIPVVAGFQGVTPGGDVTTLGRGGSDLTAVLLGAALEASAVELYKDVDGIYDRDPTEHVDANLFARMDYDRLLTVLANGGHAVVQSGAVEYARRHQVVLRVVPFSPSREDRTGTVVKMATRMPSRVPSRIPSHLPEAMAAVAPDFARPPAVPREIPIDGEAARDVAVFEDIESNVRTYCRSFPTVFARAKGALMFDEAGRSYIDFFAGAGALNYGHNPDFIRERLIEHLKSDSVTHALDMFTPTKRRFLEQFRDVVLRPRQLDYKVQFCGPTGANSVEAALKLARLATGRVTVASFTGGWHGMTAACLSVTGNREHREAAGAPLPFTTVLPYPDGPYRLDDALGYVTSLFDDPNSGLDLPAAVIMETVQGEGGIYVAPPEWLRGIRALCDKHGVLMIVDDVQVGCGRAGSFFSFERAGIVPDLVCLSKSIGGYGLPMSLLLMKRELDVWTPGQHTGTFRGNQLAFLAATEALSLWKGHQFEKVIAERAAVVEKSLRGHIAPLHGDIEVRGIGLMWGLDMRRAGGAAVAKKIGQRCFERGLIIERCGRDDTVLKVMPPLTIDVETLKQGLRILEEATTAVLAAEPQTGKVTPIGAA
ncbi:MAG TPA: diaminobutyrate--2-oxoglutarate transaminase [Labilithrix sp.]|nr:diaminobutyrate--2-oxoglutarate transaminase [Labilithrix sp.]